MTSLPNRRYSTPELNQNSSDEDDFKSARGSLSPASDVPDNWTGFSPGPVENSTSIDHEIFLSFTSSRELTGDEIEIPPPITHDLDGKRLEWNSLDSIFEALQEFAKKNGFAVKKHTRKLREGRVVMQYINCVRGGQRNITKVSTPNRKRQSKSIISDKPCPFRACLKEQDKTYKWNLEILHETHNHAAADRSTVFAVHRRNARKAQPRLIQQVHADADAMIEANRSWRSIRKTFPDVAITIQDIRNQRYKYSTLLDGGLPAIQALIRDLDGAFAHQEVVDDHGHLVHILFFQYSSLQLLRRWPFALGIDCTYKTNRHGLYLCQIIGVTALNTSFIAGQAFLSSEDKESYTFVLRWLRDFYTRMNLPRPTSITTDRAGGLLTALKEVWPEISHLLCIWHINKDVEAHCKQLWRQKFDQQPGQVNAASRKTYVDGTWSNLLSDWHRVINATSILECDLLWTDLCSKWSESNQEVVIYLRDTWMTHKEQFCAAWTSLITHYGNATTSRVEGMHRAVKAELPNRQGHLRTVIRAFQAYNERLNEQIEDRLANERIRIDLKLRYDEVFHGLHTQISSFALKKVLEHVESFKKKPSNSIGCCTNRFTSQWGVPCAHIYLARKTSHISLQVHEFHAQWRLESLRQLSLIDPLYLLKDPIKVRSRLSLIKKSNERELSRFEHVRNEGNPVRPTQAQKRRPKIKVPQVTHHPASVETILASVDGVTPTPLYLIPMGDEIQLGGFRMASELVNWDQYHANGGASFAYKLKNEKAWIPDLCGFNNRPEKNFEWSSDEEDFDRDLWGERIVSESARSDILAIRRSVVVNQLWLQDKRRQRASLDPRVLSDAGPRAMGLDIGLEVDDALTAVTEARECTRKSQRQRRPKRHFDEMN
jgi:hypothetical protein